MTRNGAKLGIRILHEDFAICRLGKDEAVPHWASNGIFFSITRTAEELSVVCPESLVPAGIKKEEHWKCLKVEGPLDFSLTGVLSSLTEPLARGGIGVFALSTYDTDYLLVKKDKLDATVDILVKEGHEFRKSSG
jgi:hypothetical protein